MGTLEGRSPAESRAQLELVWIDSVKSNWAFWIPVQCLNLSGIVPARYQVLFSNGAGVAWNCFLSLQNSKTRHTATTSKARQEPPR
jgi:hypothetical protein